MKNSDAKADKKMVKSELKKFAKKDKKEDMAMIKKAVKRKGK